mmetsp:Transcript_95983/g.311324  ORF Transcript_95983/g.311324 Transcript_95983/m.311324 type:complete len:263 (+) Transcript_95983:1557-2345(+)
MPTSCPSQPPAPRALRSFESAAVLRSRSGGREPRLARSKARQQKPRNRRSQLLARQTPPSLAAPAALRGHSGRPRVARLAHDKRSTLLKRKPTSRPSRSPLPSALRRALPRLAAWAALRSRSAGGGAPQRKRSTPRVEQPTTPLAAPTARQGDSSGCAARHPRHVRKSRLRTPRSPLPPQPPPPPRLQARPSLVPRGEHQSSHSGDEAGSRHRSWIGSRPSQLQHDATKWCSHSARDGLVAYSIEMRSVLVLVAAQLEVGHR